MYLGLSAAFLLGGGMVGARLLGLNSALERLLAGVIITLAEVVVISLTVGLLPGGFRPLPLTAASGILLLMLLAVAFRTGRAAVGPLEAEERPYLHALLAVVACTLPIWLWLLFSGLLLPPTYWDESYYQLVAPAMWTRTGAIRSFASHNLFVMGYPANFNLLPAWSMVMTGTDVWVDLEGLPFVFAGLGAVMAFCRTLGVRAWNAFWAGLLTVTTPMVIFHAKAAYIDLPLSATYAISSYFLYRFAVDGRRTYLLLGAAGMGILVGAKYSGPYMAIAGLLPILYRLSVERIKRTRWHEAILAYGLPILALGAFWYIRNLVLFGSPLYPMQLQIGGHMIFDGVYAPDAFTFTSPENGWVTLGKALLDTDPQPLMDSFYSGFGPQLLLLGVPASVLFLWRQKEQRRLMMVVWLLPMLLTVAALPARYPRYLIYLAMFLLPFAGWLLGAIGRWQAAVVKAVAVTFALYSVLVATPIYNVHPQAYPVTTRSVWEGTRVGPGEIYYYIPEMNAAKGGPLRIVASRTRLTYPMLGERWQNELLLVAPDSEEAWVRGVLAARADLLIVDDPDERVTERQWASAHPDVFRPIYVSSASTVWLVVPGDDPAHQLMVERLKGKGAGL